MMEPGSFTSEPQYQRPDQRNSDIDYIRRPEPVQAPAVVPGVAPVPPAPEFGWDPLFARRHLELPQYLLLLNLVGIPYLPEDFSIKWEENILLVIDWIILEMAFL